MQPYLSERARRADIAACRALLRTNSRTFFAASLMLPRAAREPASALYAFCRVADDAVDLHGGRMDAVAALRERLDRAYRGRPFDTPVDRAFAALVHRYALPRTLPDALLEGLAWDAEGRRYRDLPALFDYCARVAGTVGAMMSVLMDTRSEEALARACDLGVAMQLTNIARDVGEDARAGRVYLPLDWLHEAGIDADRFVAQPAFTTALGSVVERLLANADSLYARVGSGVAHLPGGCRPGIHAARLLYAEIGGEVARTGFDSVSRRAVVPPARKAGLLARAMLASVTVPRADPVPALEQTRYLVEAARTLSPAGPPPWWRLGERILWVIDLFERLERRDRTRSTAAWERAWNGSD